MRSILTATPLKFGVCEAVGIAGVATDPRHQRRGLGRRLLQEALTACTEAGRPAALLFAHRPEVYEAVGFVTVDEVVSGPITSCREPEGPAIDRAALEVIYDRWAEQDPTRLIRDASRWRYWDWMLRGWEPLDGGYVCIEGSLCREAILAQPHSAWPVPTGCRWSGLRSLTETLGVPIQIDRTDLILMARRFPGKPQMFMTDQF